MIGIGSMQKIVKTVLKFYMSPKKNRTIGHMNKDDDQKAHMHKLIDPLVTLG